MVGYKDEDGDGSLEGEKLQVIHLSVEKDSFLAQAADGFSAGSVRENVQGISQPTTLSLPWNFARLLSTPAPDHLEGPQAEERFWIDALPQQSAMFGFGTVEAFTPDRWLYQGDTVTVGSVALAVRHCPGHTPGHVVFFDPASRIAFVGDVLFQGSIGRTDFPRGDYDTLIRSIREQLWPLGDDVAFIPGHGPMSTFGQERRSNPFVGDRA
ncbi:MAG: MBL fold metallo-hydrolase [Syntrophaceae bacterium]|nr:MBL fold metallo-hydrolase [Syntrophaceae bacterium]